MSASPSSPSDRQHIAVVGAGYIGAVLSAVLADRGARVTAIDVNPRIIEAYRAGRSPVREPGLDDLIASVTERGLLEATDDVAAVALADVILITVGTPLGDDGTADTGHIDAAVASLRPYVRDGQLVVVKSTVPPYTTARRVAAPLREMADVLVAFCPERLAEGDAIAECRSIPVVVGGVDEASGDAAEAFWREALGVETIRVDSARAAELVKLANNAWIDLNIALAAELAQLADRLEVDVLPIIKAANSLPKGEHHVNVLTPSVGVGGYCLTKDPWFLDAFARAHGSSFRTAVTSRTVNEESPVYAADRLLSGLQTAFPGHAPGDTRIAVLGVAFKNNTGDCRFTPSLPFIERLRAEGYDLVACDPWIDADDWSMFGDLVRVDDPVTALGGAHAVAMLAGHDALRAIEVDVLAATLKPGGVVFDGRMFYPRDVIDALTAHGLVYRGVGR